MINIQFVFGFIGAAVGIVIGILVFGQIVVAVDCPGEINTQYQGKTITSAGKYGDPSSGASPTEWKGTGANALNVPGYQECTNAKTTAWTVLGILPITLFFVLFSIFGAFGRQE